MGTILLSYFLLCFLTKINITTSINVKYIMKDVKKVSKRVVLYCQIMVKDSARWFVKHHFKLLVSYVSQAAYALKLN